MPRDKRALLRAFLKAHGRELSAMLAVCVLTAVVLVFFPEWISERNRDRAPIIFAFFPLGVLWSWNSFVNDLKLKGEWDARTITSGNVDKSGD